MKKNYFLIKILFTTLLFFAIKQNSSGQATITDAYASIADSTGQNNFFTIVVSDTTGISEVEVRLGNELATSDIMLHSFSYDVQPLSPYSFSRTGNKMRIGIGSITLTDVYYGEVRLKDSSGNWGSPFQFITN